ncbi:MAG: histidine triad nucleotide-binding protein [Ruminococcus sp.]|jgi:histidine triad (HIT) family protein|nr:histidine triad nucleotide-binding protein [Ruminococcus sp.]
MKNSDDCIFCKIIKGEIPSEKVYENEFVLGFKDVNPVMPVHILFVPKEHIASALDINANNSAYIGKVYEAISEYAREIGIDNIEENGFRVVNNCGKDGGQTVFHIHFHLLAGGKMGIGM